MTCIVFFRTINYLDDILPLIFELKKAGLISSADFITVNKKSFDYIKRNIVLYDGIKTVHGKLRYLNKYKNRCLNRAYNLFVLRKYLYKKIITMQTQEMKNSMLSILLTFNKKLWKGKNILSRVENIPFNHVRNINNYCMSILGKKEIVELRLKDYDAILLTHTCEQFEQINDIKLITDSRIIYVGYTRALKEWKMFLDNNIEKYISKVITRPCFFFILDVIGPWIKGEKCASGAEKFEECLSVFKDYNDDIMTVFKPHHKTEIKKAQEILDSVGYKNYIISNLHPLILIKNAKFTFSYNTSSLLCEAHFNGCTTVEYADYDNRYHQYSKGKPIHLDCVDYFISRNTQQLRQVANKLVYNDIDAKINSKKLEEKLPILSSEELRDRFGWL